MSKRIFKSVVAAALLAVLFTSVLLVPSLYTAYESRIAQELEREARYIEWAMRISGSDPACLKQLHSASRVTLIAPDGTVLFDNAADTSLMENHAQRPEVRQAFEAGSGKSTRYSSTLSEVTLYYAHQTADGQVVRIANTRSSVLGMFWGISPQLGVMLLAAVFLSMLIARRSARLIVSPINALNLDAPLQNDAYDELTPLLTRMDHQHKQLSRQMQALKQARTELAVIMENMREGLVMLDPAGLVLSINKSAARIFGTDAQTRIGQQIFSITHDKSVDVIVQQAQDGQYSDVILTRGEHSYHCFASPVSQLGVIQGVVLLILDLTERLSAEVSRREFTANVSHELKTPLTSISGYAELIRDGIAQPQDIAHFAGKIHAESQRLIALVNDILELSRLDEKQVIGAKEPVELSQLLETLVDELGVRANAKSLSLTFTGCHCQVQGYTALIREMFFNLIDNAIKYTPEGGAIRVTLERSAQTVRCTVADNGIGIPEEHQAHVFERFYRVDKSHSKATGGTGLGLAIVKHIAQVHQAQLKLESAEGAGTRVNVLFPL